MSRVTRLTLAVVPLLVMLAVLVWPATALGQGPVTGTEMAMSAPSSVVFGSSVHVSATLADAAGNPVPSALIKFYTPVTFLAGTSGLEELDQATTDSRGVASIDFVPKRTESMHVVAKFEGDAQHSPSQAEAVAPVSGNHQLYLANAGIRVPLVNKWWLVGVLSFVWGTYFLVVNLVLRIASAPH